MSFLLLAGLCIPSESYAQMRINPIPTDLEMIDEVSRVSGVSKDKLGVLINEKPKLFEKFNDTVTAVKVIDLFFYAKDVDDLADIVPWRWDHFMESFVQKSLPSPMLPFIRSIRIYKLSRALLPEYVEISSIEKRVYLTYRSVRGGRQDYQYATPEDAYTKAAGAGTFFSDKQKMYDGLIMASGYNAGKDTGQTARQLWAKVDMFWKNRLEATYQYDLFKENHKKLKTYLWKGFEEEIAAIRSAASTLKTDP